MKKNHIIIFILSAFFAALCTSFQPIKTVQKQPNIILIIADDLGYNDLASYGNNYLHTPNIDALGTNGIRFTNAYVTSPICSPSRIAIMTGRYQQRFGCEYMPYEEIMPEVRRKIEHSYLPFEKKTEGLKSLHAHVFLDRKKYSTGLPGNEIVLAELLKKAGYTTGLVGKWNLGSSGTEYPEDHGYDYSYFFSGALTRYVDDPVDTSRYVNMHLPWAFSELPAWQPRYGSTLIREGRKEVKDTGYSTFSFTQKAVDFINNNADKPFYLTLAYNAPHDPFQAPKDYFDKITNVKDSVKRVYYAMIEAMDDGVGRVMQTLKEKGLDENTLVIFISDNGGATYTHATDNAPLRGGKCTHFEGGLVVPFFIQYPSKIKGGAVYAKPVSSLDIFSTIASSANIDLPKDRVYDGVNLLPYITSETKTDPHNVLYWRSGYSKAYLKDNWKLYINQKDNRVYLFDLSKDIAEEHDLSKTYPEKIKQLKKELETWERTQTVAPLWPSSADVSIKVRGTKFKFPT
jgi:arylsulfatase A-like enzyme